jgi:ATP adenylyltransferase
MAYIEKESKDPETGCIFCPRIAQADDAKNLIVHRSSRSAVFMNKYPYNNGHLLVMPQRHVGELDLLEPGELLELVDTVRLARRALDRVMHPHGYNVGLNLGKVAGAGVPDHLHFHIVPRWDGDTNFMPVLADVKVMPEHLLTTLDKLARAFQELSQS